MRKNTRIASKKVYISEAEEQERIKKTEAKKAIVKAEFEKYKKELKVNIDDRSKTNEIRLKNQLEELLAANMKKTQELQTLENTEQNLEKQNLEAAYFYEAVGKSSLSKPNETFISAGFHPNRTISQLDGVKESNRVDFLSAKKAQLVEMLSNIELLVEQEDEAALNVQGRFEELKKNEVIVRKKINELQKMHHHADKRFVDLYRVEFLALTKQATTENNLRELKSELRGLRDEESAYMMQKEEEMKQELNLLGLKQTEISNVLIELDKKRQEHQQKQEEVKKLDLQYEDVRDKRKNTKIVTKYIEALNALRGEHNLMAAHQALKSLSEKLDASRDQSPFKRPSTHEQRQTPYNFEETPKRIGRAHDDSDEFVTKRDSLLDRNYYIEKIRKFNEDHPEGPDELADNLIQQYQELCYKEESWKTYYEELQNEKKNQENLFQSLQEELALIKGKNEYITMGRSGSKILDDNEQDAIDSGMVVINSEQTTLNQAKFDFENKKDSDNQLDLFTKTEAFVMRCYLDSVEMIFRFSKLLSSISKQADGYVSEEFRDFTRNIDIQLILLKRGKKLKQNELSTSQAMSDGPAQPGTQTDGSDISEIDDESLIIIDLQEIYDTFLGFFEGCTQEASEFVKKLRSDVIVASFVTVEDVKTYLQSYQNGILVEAQIQKLLKNIDQLRKVSIENMIQKFEIIYKLYMEINTACELAAKEVSLLLDGKGIRLGKDQIVNRKAEPNTFVKKAIEKKWQNLMERYDYDPTRDYRKAVAQSQCNTENIILNKRLNAKENPNYEKETYDREDVKAKLNEIGVNGLKKLTEDSQSVGTRSFFRHNEEEKRRFQAKKAQEKQKQAIENMTDEDFLNWQRKQIKSVKEDYVYEINEGQLLMKAQADLAARLSQQPIPLEELKKMIENSKFISKIQILEKQKSVCDGKRSLKYGALENYIPPDPIKVPKSSRTMSQEYKIKTTRNTISTPSANFSGTKLLALATDRGRTDTEVTDSSRDRSFRATTTKNTSRFKPQDFHLDFSSAQILETEKSYNRLKRLNTVGNFKQWPTSVEESARKQNDNTTAANSSMPQTQREGKQQSKKSLLIKKIAKINQEKRLTKSQSQKIDLPQLTNLTTKKKTKLSKKKRTNNSNIYSAEQETINQFISLQTDPLFKMVYSPNFFTPGLPNTTFPDDLDYKFDLYEFKAPGLLVSDKI